MSNLNNRESNDSDTNRSEFNLANRQHFSDEPKETTEHEIENNFEQNDFVISDNNFTISERPEKNYNINDQYKEEEEEEEEEEAHDVTITVKFLACFPTEREFEKELAILESGNKPRGNEGPKPINFYKFEYQLIPDDPDTLYSADLVTYKSAVKIFPDKLEPKIVKGWEDENKIWVTWNISHDLKMTKSLLLKFFEHEIVVKIWNSKDFCQPRTKFDKPKPFKFSKTEYYDDDFIKMTIMSECDKYLKQIPIELHEKMEKKLPNQAKTEVTDKLNESIDKSNNFFDLVPSRTGFNQSVGNKISELAADVEMNKNVKSKYSESRAKSTTKLSKLSASQLSSRKGSRLGFKTKEKSKKELAAEFDQLKRNGINRIKLKTKILFAGYKYNMVRLQEEIPYIDDCFVSINLENDLMSEQQLYDLNPIAINIQKVTDMPEKPISFDKLRELCEKVYCSYNFFNLENHKTSCFQQDKNLYFNDVNVYLTGLLKRDELHEYLHAAPFEIEIHDRDRKPLQLNQPLKTACLFGNDPEDEQISSVNAVASKQTLYNPFEIKDKRWDPYGVAKLILYELVLGKVLLEFFVPVLPCIAPDVLGRNATKTSSNTKVLGKDESPISPGQYLDTNTHLNVKITLAKPLFHDRLSKSQQLISDSDPMCVFGRIVIKIDSNNLNLIKSLLSTIRDINAKSLNFNDHPLQVQEAALSTYRLNEDEVNSKTLDIITGFHLVDPKSHLIVIEGLKDLGIKLIHEMLSNIQTGCEYLHNSAMCFSKRLYSPLNVELLKIKLFEPLEKIVQKPVLYIRDMTPKVSFDALMKINQLFIEHKLRNVIRCDLLPTADMVLSMSKEFGIPLSEVELKKFKLSEMFKEPSYIQKNKENINPSNSKLIDDNDLVHNSTKIPHTSRIWTPIDNFNENFISQKKEKESISKDYMSKNKQQIYEKSEQNKMNKPIKQYITADTAFNYSSQTLNSTELALNKFRDFINEKTPNKLYTYSSDYHHSTTFVPVNIKREEKDKLEESKIRWKSKEGWIYPDVKTSMQSNEHPKKLDQASIDKINEPWEENILHVYKMKSPLDRTFFKYPNRNQDFDLWKKPKDENNLPVTIFESGDTKAEIEKELMKEEKIRWKSKVLVDNTDIKVHKLSAATEMKLSGFSSSNQIDKLVGILKTEPKKKGLLAGGANFHNIPALSSIKTEYEDEQTRFINSKGFIAGSEQNLRITDDKNRIPVHYYDHSKYVSLKGKDFDTFGPARSPVYKRSIELLNFDKEANTNDNFELKSQMFIIPNKYDYEHIKNLKTNVLQASK